MVYDTVISENFARGTEENLQRISIREVVSSAFSVYQPAVSTESEVVIEQIVRVSKFAEHSVIVFPQ
jgi:hypothetical protein